MSRKIAFHVLWVALATVVVLSSCDDDGGKKTPGPACEVTVEVPNVALTWKVGETYLLRWSSEGPCGSRARVELLQGGEVCAALADSAAGAGGLLWTCAACGGDSAGYAVRVTDLATGRSDISDADFTISPSRGDRIAWTGDPPPSTLVAGSTLTLHWSSAGFAGNHVLIVLLCDGAACDTIAAAAANSGNYLWTVTLPSPGGTDYALRICDLSSGATAVTPWTFHILPGGSLTVTAPNGGETWRIGTQREITWTPAGTSADSVRIELLRDGAPCRVIAERAPGGGIYAWTAAGCPYGFCDYRVRVTSVATGASDASDAPFCLVLAGLSLTAPNGGETWYEGEPHAITWIATGAVADSLTILLLRDGAVCDTITTSAPTAEGSFAWTAAACECVSPPCDPCTYTVQITDPTLGIADASNAEFCLPAPQLTVTAPNGGEAWNAGDSYTIAWSQAGPAGDAVRIELWLNGAVCLTLADSAANTGEYPWTSAPCGADTTGYRIRVTDLETGASDASDDVFRIPPSRLALHAPNGGEQWITGGNYAITWGRSGRAGDEVRLELLNEGEVCATIAAGTPNDRSFTWTAAQCGGDSCAYRVRITDLESGVSDTSDALFCVRSHVFTVLAPVAGDRWYQGTTREISWTRAGTSGDHVRIELLHDGAVCDTIAAQAPNTRSYLWTAAPCVADTCGYAVRVTDTTTLATDVSAGTFCLPPSTLTVMAPDDGDEWIEGTLHDITWEQAGQTGAAVKIELLHDGEVCATIASSAENTGSFAWTAATCATDSCGYQVRVTDLTAGTSDESSGAFCVLAPRLVVTAPDGGETWLEDRPYSILWNITGTAGPTVAIELVQDGEVCATIAAAATNNGAHAWIARACTLVPGGYRVRVSDPATGAADVSDAAFTITPTLTVTSPDGGEEWIEGMTQAITWTHSPTHGDSVRIELLLDGGVCDTLVAATPNVGTFSWAAQRCGTATSGYTVRITDLTTGAADASDEEFSITAPSLTVLDPDGGEQWLEGTVHTITWSTQGTAGAAVMIELLHAGQPVDTLSASTANDGAYDWPAVQHERHTTGYRVRVTDLTTGAHDASDATFSIVREFRVTAPNGGESWYRHSVQNITWVRTASAGDSIMIELLHAGAPCDTIAAATPNDGSHPWTVSDPVADSCQYTVRITDLTTADQDASNDDFCVRSPVLAVTSPAGGEIWDAGSTVAITWSASPGMSDSVMIALLAGGAICDTIVAAAPNTGSYDWVIEPCAGAGECSYGISVHDVALAVADTSADAFCILPKSVTLTSPAGGEEWYNGATYTIAWTHTETAGDSVRLLLVRDGAVRDTIAASTANDDSLRWTARRSGGVSIGYWITVTDLTTGDVDSTGGAFRINPGPTLTAPNGGEAWVDGDERNVTWTDPALATHSMRLELLRDGTVCDTLTNGTDNDGSFAWTVAPCGADTSGYRVRITNTNTGGSDLSDAVFNIFPDPTVTYPNGGETLEDGEDYTITWLHATGSGAQNVLVTLLRAGAACDTIAASTPNDGAHEWTFTQCDGESTGYKILITNLTTEAADSSDAAFSIE